MKCLPINFLISLASCCGLVGFYLGVILLENPGEDERCVNGMSACAFVYGR